MRSKTRPAARVSNTRRRTSVKRSPRVTLSDILVWAIFTAFVAAVILAASACTWLVAG